MKSISPICKYFVLLACVSLGLSMPVFGASPAGDVVGKITVGYQGWFAAIGDGSPINQWWHWSNNWSQAPSATNQNIHFYPDMREYSDVFQTAFANLGNGQPATLFSSFTDQSIETHFKWMAQNGCDTAALQRFNPTGQTEGPTRNAITPKVQAAAEIYGRKFYIMYDISGWTNMATEMESDWTNVINAQMQLTSSPAYAKQNGKPVVCIWGMGFNDSNHNFDATTCTNVINWFKGQGCYVIGGVPTHWRTQNSDSRPNFLAAYSTFNMLSPWMVGRIGTAADSDNFYTNDNVPDVAYCVANGIDYQPCVLPGDIGQRAHGDFMWRQFANMIKAGANGIYISMFDEYGEGNQIAKSAEDASMTPTDHPSNMSTLDSDGTHCSSDYYLRLTADGGRMLKGQIALTYTRPTAPTPGGPVLYETEDLAVQSTSSGDTHRIIEDPSFSGQNGTILDANAVNDQVTYVVPYLKAGPYNVRIGLKKHSTRGIWQLAIGPAGGGFTNLGSPQDNYSAGDVFTEINLGTWSPGSSSGKWFRFTITGKNASSGGFTEAFDYIKLTPQ